MNAKLIALPLAIICSMLLVAEISTKQALDLQPAILAVVLQAINQQAPDLPVVNLSSLDPKALNLQCLKPRSDKLNDHQIPQLVLWSWAHDDNLTYIDPKQVGVAYYAGTIVLGRDNATMQKRRNFLHINDQVVCFPSFRIEKAHADETVSELAFSRALEIVTAYAKQKQAMVIQIDFDATARDRKPYLKFLQELKKNLPDNTAISITALGSWCLYDKWLQEAAVDETVAMMFSLGREKRETLAALAHMPLDSAVPCTQSLGISVSEESTNEKLEKHQCLARAKRIYAFSSLGWTQGRYESVLAEAGRR